MELARHRTMGGRMQVDSTPEQLARGDMYLYNSIGGPDGDGLGRKSSMWQPPGVVRDDPLRASILVMRRDGSLDNEERLRGAASNLCDTQHGFTRRFLMIFKLFLTSARCPWKMTLGTPSP